MMPRLRHVIPVHYLGVEITVKFAKCIQQLFPTITFESKTIFKTLINGKCLSCFRAYLSLQRKPFCIDTSIKTFSSVPHLEKVDYTL